MAGLPQGADALVRDLIQRRCVLFAGAGLSAQAGLPTWALLLQKLIDETPEIGKTKTELKVLLSKNRLLEVAEYCKGALNDQRFATILQESLTLPRDRPLPRHYTLLSSLPFAAAITTNYDRLLEFAFAANDDGRLPKTITHRDISSMGPLLFDGGFFILKAHGDLDRPETLILGTRDYQRIMHEGEALTSVLSAILLTKRIVFVGYSLSDPDFRMIVDRQFAAFRGYLPEHFAVMTGVGPVEANVLARTANIRIINYSDNGRHEDLLPFLEALSYEVKLRTHQRIPKPGTAFVARRARPKIAKTVLSLRLREDRLFASIQKSSDERVIAKARIQLPDLQEISALLEQEPGGGRIPLRDYDKTAGALTGCMPNLIVNALNEISEDTTVVLRLSPELEVFPWEWLKIKGDFLLLRNPLVRAPIGIADRARGYASPSPPIRGLIIGDPGRDLKEARKEALEISKIYSGRVKTTEFIGSKATLENVSNAIRSNQLDLIHFAGGGWFDIQESYLELADNTVLHASELRSFLSARPPAILFLNSHYTAFLPPGLHNPRTRSKSSFAKEAKMAHVIARRGFTRAAVAGGVGAIIGSFGNPTDQLSRTFGKAFHEHLANGESVVYALRSARQSAAELGAKINDASWLLYTMTGYPELSLLPKTT